MGCGSFGDSDEVYTGEDEHHGNGFGYVEVIKTKADAYYGSYDWLDVVIHTHNGRTQVFLTNHNAYISYESSEEDHIGYSQPFG